MPAGRPIGTDKYKTEYNDLAYKYCLLHATDEKLAEFFEISESTLNEWKIKYPHFSESIKRGKEIADMEVAQSLVHRAKGYSHKEDKIFYDKDVGPVIVPTIKHYAPDTLAAMYWLNNRNPNRWKQKQEIDVSVNGEIDIYIGGKPAGEDLPDSEE